jgi:hypothetical protein
MNRQIKNRLLWIGLFLVLYQMFFGYVSNKDVCRKLDSDISGYYETKLDSLGYMVNKNILKNVDSFSIHLHKGGKFIFILSDRYERLVFPDTTRKNETERKEIVSSIIKESYDKITNSYEKMLDIQKMLFDLSYKPDLISFNGQKKTVTFIYPSSSIGFNKMRENITVVFMGKKIKSSVSKFKDSNYPAWYLSEWVYEIRPQWYILYNTSLSKFLTNYNSLLEQAK